MIMPSPTICSPAQSRHTERQLVLALALAPARAIVPIPGTGSSEHAEENIAVSPGGPPKAESPDTGPRPAAPQAPP